LGGRAEQVFKPSDHVRHLAPTAAPSFATTSTRRSMNQIDASANRNINRYERILPPTDQRRCTRPSPGAIPFWVSEFISDDFITAPRIAIWRVDPPARPVAPPHPAASR